MDGYLPKHRKKNAVLFCTRHIYFCYISSVDTQKECIDSYICTRTQKDYKSLKNKELFMLLTPFAKISHCTISLFLPWKFSATIQVKCLQCSSLDSSLSKPKSVKNRIHTKKIIWFHSSAPSSLALYIYNKNNFEHWFTTTILGILSIRWKYSYKRIRAIKLLLSSSWPNMYHYISHFITPSHAPILSH